VDVNRIPSILLQTFLTVAEAGQISEAARRLHLSQPTVTGHIRRLEANLETTLFIRSANGVSLTERGADLRERVQDVFAELEQMLRELDGTREVNGTLTLAASTTVARYFVPRIFIRFHHYHPATALHLIVGNTEEVLDHLRQQRVGLGLVLVLATVTASSAVASRRTSTHVKRGQIHFEAVVPQNAQQDDGWYKPARSPVFKPYLYGG
jgi:DNA-binding transcriptional LysR family regulator